MTTDNLRINQVIKPLGPVLVQILKNVILFKRSVAITLGKQSLTEVVKSPSEIRFESNGLPKSFDRVGHARRFQISFAKVVLYACVARFQSRELFIDLDRLVIFFRLHIPRAQSL